MGRAGQDQGGPRLDTLTKKSKSTKLLHIVLCNTQGVVAYDPVLFGGCIPPTLTPLMVKLEALILISIGGRTLHCGIICTFFMFLYYQNWLLSPTMELVSQKVYTTTHENKRCVFFIFDNKFEHVTSNTQFRLAQIRVDPFIHIMLQVCHRGKSSHRCAVTLWNDGIYHEEIVLKIS